MNGQRENYAINGRFFGQRLSGIQRYSIELLAELDSIVPPGLVELILPPDASVPRYKNIRTVTFGAHRGFLWEQIDYPRYLKQSGRKGLCTCNVIPVLGFQGDAVIHDVCYRARPDFYTDPRGRLSALWHRFQYRLIARKAERIITVSEFSKAELTRYYKVDPTRITVIYNAWQQMERVEPDETVFTRQPALQKGKYYFTMANLLKNKNLPWILRAAQNAPESVFTVAGGGNLKDAVGEKGLVSPPNVLYLGYVTDGAAKALMANCKAFLFPTLYEGFGIPPLEAVACGAPQILVSDTPCMREVYGPHAAYIDLKTNAGDVKDILPAEQPAASVLSRYSWRQSAEQLAALLMR